MNPRTIPTASSRRSLARLALLGACGLAGFVTLSAWAAPEPTYPALGAGLSLVERQYLFDAKKREQYDPTKFIYLGSANDDVYLCIARVDAPVQKFEDLFSKELLMGGVQSSSPADNPIFINNLLKSILN